LLYADHVTKSIEKAMDETIRRRRLQKEFNKKHNITPETISKNIKDVLSSLAERDYVTVEVEIEDDLAEIAHEEIPKVIHTLTKEMFEAAADLEFEKAAELRDRIKRLEERQISYG
jgi:excinuclease ABC subunit B